jgi:hypothetical protein
MDPAQTAQLNQYLPWLLIAGVAVLFLLLRLTRKGLRRRVDEIGYRLRGERGLMIWFWLNAPGVMLHELSHAFVVLLFYPFGFRVTSITLFHVRPRLQIRNSGRGMKTGNKQSLQLGEVQYTRPSSRLVTYIGDGLSGIAPLFGGIAMFILLYWLATGYNVWDYSGQHAMLRPNWPWWPLLFVPYLILTVTSELWPSSADWRGASWFVGGMALFILLIIALFWLTGHLVFNHALLVSTSSIARYIDFALLVLVGLDLVFLAVAELIVQFLRR